MTASGHEEPAWLVKQRQEEERTERPFKELAMPFLGVGRFTGTTKFMPQRVTVFERVDSALRALREFRRARNQNFAGPDEEVGLAIAVTADELAAQIAAKAGPEQDHTTIAWVLAGLRCPRRPFCTGCPGCFTVTSPLRDCEVPS